MGTWDMPHHIPNPYIHTTARHPEAAQKLIDQVKASPLNHVSNGFVPHLLFPHCRKKPPIETDEERCRRLQSSLPDSPPPPQGEEAPGQPDSAEGEKETLPHKLTSPVSLEPCPGSGGQAGSAAQSGSGTRPHHPLPQQYPSGAEPASRRSSPGGTEKLRVCPQPVAQPPQETGSRSEGGNSPDGQPKCKPRLIG
ncbi:basic salivary proline-rich protein 2-like [Rhincodon typus]|uniref:basic salivary proline-rich protein 2-like n=1 Tax=Rhincodon typus TaxID=259920 RepID=UPI00202EE2DC|nr:basic salivary proline-rich protein 2-like [Rhincodon typus]